MEQQVLPFLSLVYPSCMLAELCFIGWCTVEVESPLFRLCLHDRDFMAGERITNNIIKNISKSRKVNLSFSFLLPK